MRRLPLYCLNVLFLAYVGLLSFLFLCAIPFFFLFARLFAHLASDDAGRILNWTYGRFLVIMSRPLVRVERRGVENLPAGPCVAVANHRSFSDVFFCTLIPRPNIDVVVRSWPFRIPILGPFMRIARYIDIEAYPMEKVIEISREFARRGVSFVFFPEGHRSHDGKLHPFRSGAFLTAVENDLPVLPVCITGTEKLGGPGSILLRPARVVVEFLPPIYPGGFEPEKRALQLRREVQAAMSVYLEGE